MSVASRSLMPSPDESLQLAAGEGRVLEAGVVIDLLHRQLGPGLVPRVRHLRLHRGPDAFDLLQAADGVYLLALVAPVVDVGMDDDEAVLEHERDDAGELCGGILASRFE